MSSTVGTIRTTSVGTTSCDAGTGLPGDIRQQVAAGESARKALADAFSVMAIIGQCGAHSLELLGPLFPQRNSAAAGPTSSPTSNSEATTLERMLTELA